MNDLDRLHVIDRSQLSEKNYFLSLLTQGQLCFLLSISDTQRIQMECLKLLADQTKKYSHGSSSIRVEKAQELLSSIMYTAGMALKGYPSPEEAINVLRQSPVEQLFQTGLKKIKRKLQVSVLMHRQLKRHLFHTKNVFYRSTVIDGIDGFFKLYCPEFSAHEIHITADYPSFIAADRFAGIEFIEEYLSNICHENRFCSYFSPRTVHYLLCGLDKSYHQILMNIYEPVLTAALGCALTRRPIRELYCDLDTLKALLAGKSKKDIQKLLSEALPIVTSELSCPAGLIDYLKASIPDITVLIHHTAQLGCLEKTVLIPPYRETTGIEISIS